jgi:hypothetical protein
MQAELRLNRLSMNLLSVLKKYYILRSGTATSPYLARCRPRWQVHGRPTVERGELGVKRKTVSATRYG